MKRVLPVLAAAALGLCLLSACSSRGNDLLASVQSKGQLTIATEGTWAPWTYHDENGDLTGFDIEVAQAVCDKLEVKANFVEGEWDSLLMGLESGMYDTMANGVNVTPARSEKFDFSEPYAYSRTALMTRATDERIRSFEDLSGMTTANTISSTYAALAEDYGAHVIGVDDLNQTIELLLQGRVDATLNDEVTYLDYISQHPGANIKVAAYTDQAESIALPLRKGHETESLRAEIDKALAELREDGTLSALSMKYFGTDLTQAP